MWPRGLPPTGAGRGCRVHGMLVGLVAGDAIGAGGAASAPQRDTGMGRTGCPHWSADFAQALAVARHLGRAGSPFTQPALARTLATTWWTTQDLDGYGEIDRRRLRAVMNGTDEPEPVRSTGPRAGVSLAVTVLPVAARTAAQAQPTWEECATILGPPQPRS